jgi:hypothetical protein
MKKLIDELEAMARKLFRNPNANDDTCKGFDHALQIVRAHNPWHEVSELPEPDKLLWFLCGDGSVFLGYYASYIEDGETCYCWSEQYGTFYREGNEIIVSTEFDDYDVTHYRYIPTDLPEVKP